MHLSYNGVEVGLHPPGTLISDLGVGVDSALLTLTILPEVSTSTHISRRVDMPAILPLHKITNSFKNVKRKRVRAQGNNERFTREEAEALVTGVSSYGIGNWVIILKQHFKNSARSSVDLKDKWRNMCAAAFRPHGFKFRVSYFTPDFLAKVRSVQAEAEQRSRLMAKSQELELRDKKNARLAKLAELTSV
jgi:hypothetical protein|eukprot:30857-Pelagococcus_subviridis.AAC.8